MDEELRAIRARLHERMKAVKGDGFSQAGSMIGAYKRTLQQLDTAIGLAESLPAPSEGPDQSQPNERCLGRGEHNLPSCECRVIFSIISR
jgi:hypothetical protein